MFCAPFLKEIWIAFGFLDDKLNGLGFDLGSFIDGRVGRLRPLESCGVKGPISGKSKSHSGIRFGFAHSASQLRQTCANDRDREPFLGTPMQC